MNALVMMIFGACLGGSVFLAARSLRPRPLPLVDLFLGLENPGQPYGSALTHGRTDRSARGALTRFGERLVTASADMTQLTKDLAVSSRPLEQHALSKVAGPALFILATYVVWLLAAIVGVAVPPVLALLVAMGGAGLAFIAPDIALRHFAAARRTGFRHALSAYLDLVSVIIAGGGGLNTALTAAADAGDGWAFREIRTALNKARLSNQTPWAVLDELGATFAVAELSDIAATVTLAGEQGARIEASISTKADVLRSHLQAEVEKTAESRTEQMLIPVAVLLVALFLFVGFAVYSQLAGGTTFIDT